MQKDWNGKRENHDFEIYANVKRSDSGEITAGKKWYMLINQWHLNTHKSSLFVDIFGIPKPQQTDLHSVRASPSSQIGKESTWIRHQNRLLGNCLFLDIVWVGLCMLGRSDIYSWRFRGLQWKLIGRSKSFFLDQKVDQNLNFEFSLQLVHNFHIKVDRNLNVEVVD